MTAVQIDTFVGVSLIVIAAIALFVLDVFLVMIGWPATSPDESFGETCAMCPYKK